MRHRWNSSSATLVVLGILCLRALVPAGFMLAPLDGRVAFVLCGAEMSAGAQPHEHHHHHPGDGAAAHHGGAHGDPTCPYAQSAAPAPLPALPVLAGGAIADPTVPARAVTRSLQACGPIRQQTPRGPPSLA
jgi:hypothetical protein